MATFLYHYPSITTSRWHQYIHTDLKTEERKLDIYVNCGVNNYQKKVTGVLFHDSSTCYSIGGGKS